MADGEGPLSSVLPEWRPEYQWLALAAVGIGAVAAVMALRKGTPPAAAGSVYWPESPSGPQDMSSNQLAAYEAGLQAGVSKAGLDAQTEAARIAAGAQTQQSQLAANVALSGQQAETEQTRITTGGQVEETRIGSDTQRFIAEGGWRNSENLAGINANLQLGLGAQDLTGELHGQDTNLEMARLQAQSALEQAQHSNAVTLGLQRDQEEFQLRMSAQQAAQEMARLTAIGMAASLNAPTMPWASNPWGIQSDPGLEANMSLAPISGAPSWPPAASPVDSGPSMPQVPLPSPEQPPAGQMPPVTLPSPPEWQPQPPPSFQPPQWVQEPRYELHSMPPGPTVAAGSPSLPAGSGAMFRAY
jgi:hypothetical protein